MIFKYKKRTSIKKVRPRLIEVVPTELYQLNQNYVTDNPVSVAENQRPDKYVPIPPDKTAFTAMSQKDCRNERILIDVQRNEGCNIILLNRPKDNQEETGWHKHNNA